MSASRLRRRASSATGKTPLTGRTAPFKRELADKAEALDLFRIDFFVEGDHAECDRQIETRSFFLNVGRREIDRRATAWPAIRAVHDRGRDAITTFFYRRIGQSDDDDLRLAAAFVYFDFNFVGIYSVNGGGIDFREHNGVAGKLRKWNALYMLWERTRPRLPRSAPRQGAQVPSTLRFSVEGEKLKRGRALPN